MQWLDDLKVAIIEEEYETLSSLTQDLPTLSEVQMREAKTLIDEAISLLKEERKQTQISMDKIKKNSAFLAQEERKSRLSTLS